MSSSVKKSSNKKKSPSFDHWQRAIILVDMNAFFASVEQADHPEWQARPIGITNGLRGTCIITSSYEARAWGVKTGMRVKEAQQRCPGFIQVPARPKRYAEVSTRIMRSLESITPDLEVFSVDEAFLDVTRCQNLSGHPEQIAQQVKQVVIEASNGALCSIGVSGDKTTAKYAAKLNKPNGLTVIPPWQAEAQLKEVPVTELCGIAKGIGKFLSDRGVYTCGDMKHLPIGELAKRFGNPGRRIWYMAQGQDPEQLTLEVAAPKTIGHSKVMPPNTKDENVIKTYLQHMAEKVAARLRKHHLEAQRFYIGFRTKEGMIANKYRTRFPTVDGREIYTLGLELLHRYWDGQGFHQIQITALDPMPASQQQDLFAEPDQKKKDLFNTIDHINNRYGEFTISPAPLLNRSDMPNVIAPAWKPDGHRQTI
ncbi:MAG: DNA polymerase IV [Gammaproteobacteria bacterium]